LTSFLDANVPIYAVGRDHPYREPCARILSMVAAHPRAFVTDVEVLQELMHRYIGSRRWAEGGSEALQRFGELMSGRIEPFYVGDIELAAMLADAYPDIAARDLLHAAAMRRLGIERIISADRDFDRLPGVTRLDPADVDDWEASVLSG
jgi:hypothetical protein